MKWLWFILFPLVAVAQGPNPQGRVAVFTNGVFIGHALGIDFLRGATGYVAGPYLHIGVDDNAISNTPLRTNFITTAHGSATVSNGLYLGQSGLQGSLYIFDNITGGGGPQLLIQGATTVITWGTNVQNHEWRGVTVRPAVDNATQFGDSAHKWQLGQFGDSLKVSNSLQAGQVSVTNIPGVGGGFIEIRSTNGTAYTRWARFDDAYRPTNSFKDNSTNWVAGQVYKAHSVTYSAGEATIVLTNDVDNSGSLSTNANQFGTSVTLTIKADPLFTNTIHRVDGQAKTNLQIEQAIGASGALLSVLSSNSTPLFQINSNGMPSLTNSLTNFTQGATRGTPDGTIAFGVQKHGQDFPSWVDDRNRTFSPQISLFDNDVNAVLPQGSGFFMSFGSTYTVAGGSVISHEAADERRPFMGKISSAASSNSVGGIGSSPFNTWNAGAHNGSSRVGGGFFFSRWMITNSIAGIVGGGAPRFFVGLSGDAAGSAGYTNICVTTNATGQYMGLMGDPKETLEMFITCRDATAEFRTNTGINFVATNYYEFSLEQPHTNRFVRWMLRDLTSRLEASGIFSNNVPTNFMRMVMMSKNGTNRANEIYLNKLYMNCSQNPRWN